MWVGVRVSKMVRRVISVWKVVRMRAARRVARREGWGRGREWGVGAVWGWVGIGADGVDGICCGGGGGGGGGVGVCWGGGRAVRSSLPVVVRGSLSRMMMVVGIM